MATVLTGAQLREKFLSFFEEKGHARIPSASLVPENDPTVLFTTAGMQPLVPYLLGQRHPLGKRLTNVQKCIRTGDIDEVGDEAHLTFFEMLGNWSLGDYFKEEAITWSHEFLTSDRYLGIPRERIGVSVFAGDADAPRDEEAAAIWARLGVPKERVAYLGRKDNWWGPAGTTGPCGPDTEMFYDTGKPLCGKPTCGPGCDCGKWVEIWNDVFMEYEKKADGTFAPLAQKNVDTGMGLERTVAVLTGKESVYDTDLFAPLMTVIAERATKKDIRASRVIADHLRAATFIIADGVAPSNLDRGYVLRRLIRRAMTYAGRVELPERAFARIAEATIEHYKGPYPELAHARDRIIPIIEEEETKFGKTIERGLKEFERAVREKGKITGAFAFSLSSTYGFPLELTRELTQEKGIPFIEEEEYRKKLEQHQEVSRAGAQKRFTGGLADHSEQTTKLHTAHHLLLKALQVVIGPHVKQRGSNITQERLRIDVLHGEKMTDEQKREVERIVNEKITEDLPIIRSEVPKDEAERLGAEHEFGQKYPDRVSVYSIGPKDATPEDPHFNRAFSIEFCGGPHVSHTGVLGRFKITKEEAVSAGVRRIRAVLAEKE